MLVLVILHDNKQISRQQTHTPPLKSEPLRLCLTVNSMATPNASSSYHKWLRRKQSLAITRWIRRVHRLAITRWLRRMHRLAIKWQLRRMHRLTIRNSFANASSGYQRQRLPNASPRYHKKWWGYTTLFEGAVSRF